MYSFGILMPGIYESHTSEKRSSCYKNRLLILFQQEVMYRKGPFFTLNHDETPRSKMLKVKSRTGGIFRPYLGPIEAENICMNELEWLVI